MKKTITNLFFLSLAVICLGHSGCVYYTPENKYSQPLSPFARSYIDSTDVILVIRQPEIHEDPDKMNKYSSLADYWIFTGNIDGLSALALRETYLENQIKYDNIIKTYKQPRLWVLKKSIFKMEKLARPRGDR